MFTQNDSLEYARNFLIKIKGKGINIKYAILFGSYARGNQTEHSDIDIALAADEFTGFGFNDMKSFARELVEFYYIQPKTYSTKYFEKGDPFIKEIKKTGIELNVN
ncbi:MAG: uncharacterized protein QG635_1474 [Bacteroidota bacterium]|nr:uncharacterized protein [Bacteroidota bacterium]